VGAERVDLFTLVRRLIELTVQMVGKRLELAQSEARHLLRQIVRRLVPATVAVVALALGAAFAGLAAVDALAPVVTSRVLRLLLVAVPFVAVGVVALGRAKASDRLAGSATDDADDHRHQRQYEEDVNPRAERIAAHHAQQPQDEQEDADHPKHRGTSSVLQAATDMPSHDR
jgi:hypothetical protein